MKVGKRHKDRNEGDKDRILEFYTDRGVSICVYVCVCVCGLLRERKKREREGKVFESVCVFVCVFVYV
jgi:hypothetical protein